MKRAKKKVAKRPAARGGRVTQGEAEKKPRKRKKAPKPEKPGISTSDLAAALGVTTEDARQIHKREGCPKAGGLGYRFESVEAVVAWMVANSAEHLGDDRFRLTGWLASFALPRSGETTCEACASLRVPTVRRQRLGVYASVRPLRGGKRVDVRCWCSARLGKVLVGTIPEADRALVAANASAKGSGAVKTPKRKKRRTRRESPGATR